MLTRSASHSTGKFIDSQSHPVLTCHDSVYNPVSSDNISWGKRPVGTYACST